MRTKLLMVTNTILFSSGTVLSSLFLSIVFLSVSVSAKSFLGNNISDHNDQAASFFTNVPEISPNQLQPQYWIAKLNNKINKDEVLLTPQQIMAMNQLQFDNGRYLNLPLSYPNVLADAEVKKRINEISTPTTAARFYLNGKKLSASDYKSYSDNLNLPSAPIQVRFALVTQRTSLRKFPTIDRVFNAQMNTDIDRFQESAVFPGEAVTVLNISKDQQWAFVQNYHYRAWLQLKDIAFAPKHIIEQFIDAKQRLVVTGAKVFTTFNPNNKKNSEIALEMGVSLPLISPQTISDFKVSGQNPYTSYIVLLPTRDNAGKLVLAPTLISKNADVSEGYLPFTQANIIKQAFKFLGERYGWGHDFNGRDCSGFVGEIFKSFGLLLPRNTGQQAKAKIGKNIQLSSSLTLEARNQALEQLQLGDLIFLPGHVAMFLGFDNNKPYIIHDVHGMGYIDHNKQTISGLLNGVSVTPLLPFQHYVETMYNIKRLY